MLSGVLGSEGALAASEDLVGNRDDAFAILLNVDFQIWFMVFVF